MMMRKIFLSQWVKTVNTKSFLSFLRESKANPGEKGKIQQQGSRFMSMNFVVVPLLMTLKRFFPNGYQFNSTLTRCLIERKDDTRNVVFSLETFWVTILMCSFNHLFPLGLVQSPKITNKMKTLQGMLWRLSAGTHSITEVLLTHTWPIFRFYTPRKHQKTFGFSGVFRGYKMEISFLVFLGGIKRETKVFWCFQGV